MLTVQSFCHHFISRYCYLHKLIFSPLPQLLLVWVVCQPVCLSVWLSVCRMSVFLTVCLSVSLSICPSFCPSACLSVCMSVLFACLSACLSASMSTCLHSCLSVCLSWTLILLLFSFQFVQVFSVLSHWTQMLLPLDECCLIIRPFPAFLWVGSLDKNSSWSPSWIKM